MAIWVGVQILRVSVYDVWELVFCLFVLLFYLFGGRGKSVLLPVDIPVNSLRKTA